MSVLLIKKPLNFLVLSIKYILTRVKKGDLNKVPLLRFSWLIIKQIESFKRTRTSHFLTLSLINRGQLFYLMAIRGFGRLLRVYGDFQPFFDGRRLNI